MARTGTSSDWLDDSASADSSTCSHSQSQERDWRPSVSTSGVGDPSTESDSVDPDAVCVVCQLGSKPGSLLICDECSSCMHTTCIGLKTLPKEDTWVCPACTQVQLGQQSSALRSVTRLNGLRITGTSRRAVLEGVTLRQTLQAQRPAREAQVAAANKAAAAAAKKAAEDDSAAINSDAPAPPRGPGRPPFTPAQRQAAHLRRLLASAQAARHAVTASSITVAKKTADVDEPLTAAFESWMKMQPAGGMALERGGTYGHLHIQAVVKAFGATPQQVNRAIKAALERVTTPDIVVCVRKLTGRGLHTWHGMIGYIHKDSNLPHFKVCLHNISPADVAVGRQEYLKYGAGTLKKKTGLTPRNIFDKAALFTELHLQGTPMGQLNFQQTLLAMLHTGKYYPVGFVTTSAGRGISHDRAAAQWRLQTSPETAQPEDIHRVFFDNGDLPQYPTGNRYFNMETPEARMQRFLNTFFTPFEERDDTAAEGQLAMAAAAAASDPDPRRRLDDNGLGDILGYSSGFREAVAASDNLEYWQTIQAKMASLQEQPGSSARAAEIGDALNTLTGLLAHEDNNDDGDDDEDKDAAAFVDRVGADV